MLWLGNAQWARAFSYSSDATPRTVLWIINPVFMSVIDIFYDGKATGSTLDPHIKEKQIGFLISWLGSSIAMVLLGFFTYRFIRHAKNHS